MDNELRLFHLYWNLINFFQKSMLLPSALRTVLLNLAGCDIHPSARIASGVFLGSNKICLERGVFVNINCFFDGNDYIHIKEFTRIGPHVKILTGTHTINPGVLRRSGNSRDVNEPVNVQRGCWIGMGAMILPGVTVAEGCVVGAGSVIVKSTEANGMYAGSPAKRIKDLAT